MTIKRDKRGRTRDYKAEYARDQSSSHDIKRRSERNQSRKALGLKKGDPRQAHHVDGNTSNKSKGNLKAISRKKNTTLSNKKRARKS